MLSHIVMKKNMGDSGGYVMTLDGVDVSHQAVGVQMHVEHNGPAHFFIHTVSGVELDLEGVVTIVQPPTEGEGFKRASSLVRGLDPQQVEGAALEALEFGSNQNLSVQILDVIAKVFEDAATQLEAAPEVLGSEHDGQSEDHKSDLTLDI